MVSGAREEFWFDSGMWRLEIQPSHKRLEDQFLIVLIPGVAGTKQLTQIAKLPAQGAVAVVTPSAVVLVRDHNAKRVYYEIPAGEKRLHILAGVPEGKEVRVEVGGAISKHRITDNGTVAFEIVKGASRTVVVDILD